MKTSPKIKETLSRIKKNKETLFAVLLGGTRWYTGSLALPLGFIVCRLFLERLKDRNLHKALDSLGEENQRLKNLLDDMNVEVIERHNASGSEEDMSKRIVELQKVRNDLESQLKAERQGKNSLESGQKVTLAIRDAEARQNRIFKKEIERLQSETQKMKDLQAENMDKASIIATKEQKIADLEQESSNKQNKIEEMEEAKQKLMCAIDSEKESKLALNDSLEKERTIIQSLEAELKKSQQEAGEKRQLYEISMKTLASEKEQGDSLRSKVLELTKHLEAEQKTLQEQQETLTMKEGIIVSLKEYEYKSLKLTEELRSKEEEILEMKKSDEANKAMIALTEKKLSEVEEENNKSSTLRQQLVVFTRSLKDSESQLDSVTEKYEAAQKELETIRASNDALKADHEWSSDAKSLLEAEKKTTERLQSEVETLEESLKAANETNSQLQHSLDQKVTIAEAKETMLTESTSRADMLRKQIDEMEEKMIELSHAAENVDTIEKRATEAEEALLCEQAKTAELETKVEEMTAAWKEETHRASELENELDKKQRLVEVTDTVIENLRGYREKAEEESKRAQEVESEVARLNNYLGSMKLNVDELEERLEEREKLIAELKETNASLLSGKDELSAQHTARKTEEKRLHEELKDMKTEMDAEAQKLAALKKENDQLKEADLHAMQVVESLKSSLETKELAIQRKDSEIYRLHKVNEEKEQLKEKESELYKKLDNLTSSSNDVIKNLESNLVRTEASLKEERSKVESLRQILSAKDSRLDRQMVDTDENMTKEMTGDMKTIQSKYEAEKSKVITLEATRKTSQKMIRDLESILDKKETILAKKQDEIATLKRTLADVTESHSDYISETQKREISVKLNQPDESHKIKLSDMLIMSSAFHTSATMTANGTRVKSPKGKPTPESMSPWGKRYTGAIDA